MNELVYIQKGKVLCTSRDVAEKFGKRHSDVIRSIENLIENDPTQNCVRCFKKSRYKDVKGEKRPMYLMNRDGFTFLVMGFTGKKANEWKWKYINAFNQMEEYIRKKNETDFIEARQNGKLTRKAETDVLKQLVEYAKQQGSTHSDKLYMTYSKLANSMTGVTNRDEATSIQLSNLSMMENIILKEIEKGIVQGKYYKEIYKDCKNRLTAVRELAYLTA